MKLWKVVGCKFIEYDRKSDGKRVKGREYQFASDFDKEEGIGAEVKKQYYSEDKDPKLTLGEKVVLIKDPDGYEVAAMSPDKLLEFLSNSSDSSAPSKTK